MSQVRIPYMSRREDMEPLQRCLAYAAREHGVTEFDVADIMSYFLEQITVELARGNMVSIPGWGCFAPMPRRDVRGDKHLLGYAYPAFSAAVGFRQEVKYGSPPRDDTVEKFRRYQRNHTRRTHFHRERQRVFTAASAFRERIAAQRRRYLVED